MTLLNVVVFATSIVHQHGTPYQLNREVNSLLTRGNNVEAVNMARKAVRAAGDALGANHPATAMMLSNLALAYKLTGSFAQAESVAKRSLAILEGAFGSNDVSLSPALNVLAETYAAERRYVEANKMAMRAVAIGPGAEAHFATALHNVAAVLESEGYYTDAKQYYRKALVARQAMLPAGHAHTEMTRVALARVEHAEQASAMKMPARQDVSGLLR